MQHQAGSSRLNRIQPSLQISTQVIQLLQPHCNTQQAVTNPHGGALFRLETTMSSAGRMGNGCFGITQVGSNGDHSCGVNEAPGCLLAALDIKTDYSPETSRLLSARSEEHTSELQSRPHL